MMKYTLEDIVPAVVEATTLEVYTLNDLQATLVTPEDKKVHLTLVPGFNLKSDSFIIEGDLFYTTDSKESLTDTLEIVYAKPIKFDFAVESRLVMDIARYSEGCGIPLEDCKHGTYAIAKITKDPTGYVNREYIQFFRGCEGAFRWIIDFMLNNPDKGFECRTRAFKEYIYKEFDDGSWVSYAPYHLSNQEPTSDVIKSFIV